MHCFQFFLKHCHFFLLQFLFDSLFQPRLPQQSLWHYFFPQISANAGDQILVARYLNEFSQYIDTSQYWDISLDASTSNSISMNGNDAIELFINVDNILLEGDLIETFGDNNVNPDTNGAGCGNDPDCWDYEDAWAYKNNMGEWIFGEVNCTDGYSTHLEVPEDCIYPFVCIKVTRNASDQKIRKTSETHRRNSSLATTCARPPEDEECGGKEHFSQRCAFLPRFLFFFFFFFLSPRYGW